MGLHVCTFIPYVCLYIQLVQHFVYTLTHTHHSFHFSNDSSSSCFSFYKLSLLPPHLLFWLFVSLFCGVVVVVVVFTFLSHYVCMFTFALFWCRFASMPMSSHLKPQYIFVCVFSWLMVFRYNELI